VPAFGDQAESHPPLRGWLAAPVCGDGGRKYGLLQLSDKAGDADFDEREPIGLRCDRCCADRLRHSGRVVRRALAGRWRGAQVPGWGEAAQVGDVECGPAELGWLAGGGAQPVDD
jgi:hypothetical protein